MHPDLLFDTMRQALWVGVTISSPMLVIALLTGIAIGLFQALTSIQEMTLTFVPKVAAMLAVFWATMGFMTDALIQLFQRELLPLVAGF